MHPSEGTEPPEEEAPVLLESESGTEPAPSEQDARAEPEPSAEAMDADDPPTEVEPSLQSADDQPTLDWPPDRLIPRQSGRGWAITVVGLLIVAFTAWLVTNSPLFDMRELRVTGLKHLSQEQVARLGGLTPRTNVLWFSPGTVEHRLEEDPWILRAEISRNMPGTIIVSIQERTPVAVAWSSARSLLVAVDGTLLAVAPHSVRLPRIAARASRLTVGKRLPQAAAALTVVASLPYRVRSHVDRVITGTSGSISLLLRSGTRVLYGEQGQPDAKAGALAAVLAWANRHGVRAAAIDIRAPDAPALLPAGVPEVTPGAAPVTSDFPRTGPRP